MLSTTSTLLET